jgi:hypothetical protein
LADRGREVNFANKQYGTRIFVSTVNHCVRPMEASMSRVVYLLTLVAVTVFWGANHSAADETEFKPFEVQSYGKPKNYAKARGLHYYVWKDEEGWHLRAQSGAKVHSFSGAIEVVGGKFSKVANFEALETSGKQADQGKVSERRITFNFKTKGNMDGFDFRVSPESQQLRFRLLIDGDARPEQIMIGANAQPAPTSTFALNPHPEN